MRRAFLNRISEMIHNESDTIFFTVDMGMWAIRDVLKEHPDRCMNIGIFEDGMLSFAAGLSRVGFIPTIFGIQPYLIERALEQIKMDFAYQKLGVNIVGTGAACDYSKYGYSHYCAEDVMIIKSIPGCEFVAPGTPKQFLQLFNQCYRNGKPTFFRVSDHPNMNYDVDVEFGKANIIKKGKLGTIIVVSVLLDDVIKACEKLDVTIIYYTTLEPFDKNALIKWFCGDKLLVVEPEYAGSLQYDINEALKNNKFIMESIAFPREIFRNYGTYEEKMKYYKLDYDSICKKIHDFFCK